MSRKEASNTFTDGLIKDLNPINTPNTVLTDCLNGTLITYDGNEYSLQNDRGNYALKYCKLKPNYIPVGIKEYGDILYIVSYNPLNEHTEIGSYPSPETIHDADDLDDLEQTVESTLSGVVSSINYSEIVESKQPLYVFYGASEYGPNEYKLNPGDLYKINSTLSDLSIYEELKYFIFDENRKSYDVTDKVTDPNQHYDDNGFAHVNWDVPGWLAVQPTFAEITDFSVNIKKLIVPSYGNAHIKLSMNFQLSTEDELYLKNLSSAVNDLKVEFKITATGKDSTPDYSSESINYSLANFIDTKNGSISFYSNDWSALDLIASNYTSLTITAVPYVIAKTGIKVYYEKFEKNLVFNLNQKGLVSDFNIGSGHWWYNTDSSNKEFTLMFDTKGLANSSVLEQDVYLFYTIKRLDGSYVTDSSGNQYKNKICPEWNVVGETTLEFPLQEFTQANYTSYPTRFYAEDFYIITFDFYDTETPAQGTSPLRTGISKFITASELMNGQQVALYDTVSFDTWIKNYLSSIKEKKINLTKLNNGSITLSDPLIENREILEGWESGNPKSTKYSTLVSNDTFDDLDMKEGFSIVCKASCSTNIKYGTNTKLLVGPIWKTFDSETYSVFSSNGFVSDKKYFSEYEGTLIGNNNYSATIIGSAEKRIPYKLAPISSDSLRVWEYDLRELKYSTFNTESSASFDELDSGWFLHEGKWYLTINAIPSAGIKKWSNGGEYMGDSGIRTITHTEEFLASLTKQFTNNDALFIKLGVGQLSNGNRGSDWFDGMGLLSDSKTFTDKDYAAATEYFYFGALKRNSSSIALLPIVLTEGEGEADAKLKFTNWLNKIHKLEGNQSTTKIGGFYEAVEGSELVSNNVSLSLSGEVVFGSLKYTLGGSTYNLFSTSDRNSLASNVSGTVVNNLNKLDGSDITNFDSLSLDKVDDISNSIVDFSPKDSSINVLRSKINGINTLSSTQLATYGNDTILQSEEPDSSKYFEKIPGTVGGVFLDLFNNRIFTGATQLYFTMHRTTFGSRGEVRACVAYISTSNQYNIQ